jgi:hypothetical protein
MTPAPPPPAGTKSAANPTSQIDYLKGHAAFNKQHVPLFLSPLPPAPSLLPILPPSLSPYSLPISLSLNLSFSQPLFLSTSLSLDLPPYPLLHFLLTPFSPFSFISVTQWFSLPISPHECPLVVPSPRLLISQKNSVRFPGEPRFSS